MQDSLFIHVGLSKTSWVTKIRVAYVQHNVITASELLLLVEAIWLLFSPKRSSNGCIPKMAYEGKLGLVFGDKKP